MSLDEICVNSFFIDLHTNKQDQLDRDFNILYIYIVNIFRDDLEKNPVKEDIANDIYFEANLEINRLNLSVTENEVMKQIFEDFNIKGAA